MLGASLNEIGLVVIFLILVLLAPKVAKIGEAIGGLLGGSTAPSAIERAEPDPPESS